MKPRYDDASSVSRPIFPRPPVSVHDMNKDLAKQSNRFVKDAHNHGAICGFSLGLVVWLPIGIAIGKWLFSE